MDLLAALKLWSGHALNQLRLCYSIVGGPLHDYSQNVQITWPLLYKLSNKIAQAMGEQLNVLLPTFKNSFFSPCM
jgi:hypothetical protein